MKKIMMTLILALGLIAVSTAQTKENKVEKSKHEHVDKVQYACPMKCEGDKAYAKEGDCPKCGMNLTKIESGQKSNSKKKSCCMDGGKKKGHKCNMKMEKNNEKSQTSYACPMKCEGDKTYAKAGGCPKCGMELKELKKENK